MLDSFSTQGVKITSYTVKTNTDSVINFSGAKSTSAIFIDPNIEIIVGTKRLEANDDFTCDYNEKDGSGKITIYAKAMTEKSVKVKIILQQIAKKVTTLKATYRDKSFNDYTVYSKFTSQYIKVDGYAQDGTLFAEDLSWTSGQYTVAYDAGDGKEITIDDFDEAGYIFTEANKAIKFIFKYTDSDITTTCNITPTAQITPLTLTATAQTTISLTKSSVTDDTLSYSTNGGSSWTNVDSTSTLTLETGQTLQLKGKITSKDIIPETTGTNYHKIKITPTTGSVGSVEINGTLTSLINEGEKAVSELPKYAFFNLFKDSTGITKINEVKNSFLPSSVLSEGCYYGMFGGCTNLTNTPILSATAIAESCYNGMFNGCTNLTDATELPALDLEYQCYSQMFKDCTSLETPIALNSTNLAEECYIEMFSGCTNLSNPYDLPAKTLPNKCYNQMFLGCTSITSTPNLPATTLAENCYESMFEGCTNLLTPCDLPSKKMSPKCYQNMFMGCINLKTAPALPATSLATSCYYSMFEGCTSLTTAPALPAKNLTAWSVYSNMFKGCTSLEKAPDLKSTNITQSCYFHMFENCKSLKTAPELPTTDLKQTCYSSMFAGCESLQTAPLLPATTLNENCYDTMFSGCENMTLPSGFCLDATELKASCYKQMFKGCKAIKISSTDGEGYTKLFTCPSLEGLTTPVTDMFKDTPGVYTDDPVKDGTYYWY